ncbi:hypothetical protein ASPZODRAFT_91268 [Penicilliopsis zonata CBS 506.65]|uniref:SET domain-containing protein n=1 Tax=Penicilliopsis zonata CBS 506.65 TaxID=1073090 RepID=A0A1L9SPN8_9EURO|nr:hypothetical protein ASPZODRAFT_91268 [Penicilliopsis zonata CBS 506.65]OJJ49053.1 hypothetical protein ASPZODRAFT_91268 [Penicilliopsis zonata CBS 506.65]
MAGSFPSDALEEHNALLDWVIKNGGHMHESAQIARDERRGVHVQVKRSWPAPVARETRIIQTPLGVTMSYFNAIGHRLGGGEEEEEEEEANMTFSMHGLNLPRGFVDAVGPEETTAFFLMGQYLRGTEGFWFPYIRTLPQPGSLTTPLYYGEEDGDLTWLQGTSLMAARAQRMQVWKEKFENASKILGEEGFEDADRYTWDLYLWASTIITSRAFSSKVLSGVISDADLPEDRLSVLLPLIDLPNHRPLAKVEWRAGETDVALLVLEDAVPGQEISNNYGPRNNEQLMMNYGFCLPDNSCDYRIVSLRAPPGSPLAQAKAYQLQAFPDLAKDPEDHYYVFNIFYPLLAPDSPMEHTIFSPALFNAVSVLAANNRELETLEISEDGIQLPLVYGNSRAVLAALGQIIIELITHILKLRASAQGLPQPQNLKQRHAQLYRDSQIHLSETALVIASWSLRRAREHNLGDSWEQTKQLFGSHMSEVPAGKFSDAILSRIYVRILERNPLLSQVGELLEFNDLFALLPSAAQELCRSFFPKLLVRAGRHVSALQAYPGQSPLAFPLFLSFVAATHLSGKSELPPRLSRWAAFLLDKYPPPPEDVAWQLEEEDDEALMAEFDQFIAATKEGHSSFYVEVTQLTGTTDDRNDWLSPNWLRWSWMIVEQESVMLPEKPLQFLAVDPSGETAMLSTQSYLYIPTS